MVEETVSITDTPCRMLSGFEQQSRLD